MAAPRPRKLHFVFRSWMKVTHTARISNWPNSGFEQQNHLPPGFTIDTIGDEISITFDPFLDGIKRDIPRDFPLVLAEIVSDGAPPNTVTINIRFEPDVTEISPFQCAICEEPYNEHDNTSTVLRCGHTFCKKCCIERLELQSDETMDMRCPIDHSISSFFSVESLPKNFAIANLVTDRIAKGQQNEELLFKDPFVPCYENENHEATKYCETCKHAFCEKCNYNYHRWKVNAGHLIKPISDMPVTIPTCTNDSREAQLCCLDSADATIVCKRCTSTEEHLHHEHEDIHEYIGTVEEQIENRVNDLKRLEKKVTEKIEKSSETTETFKVDHPHMKRAIERIEAHFEALKEEAKQKMFSFAQNEIFNIADKKGRLVYERNKIRKTIKEGEKKLRRKQFLPYDKERMSIVTDEDERSIASILFPKLIAYGLTPDMSKDPIPPSECLNENIAIVDLTREENAFNFIDPSFSIADVLPPQNGFDQPMDMPNNLQE